MKCVSFHSFEAQIVPSLANKSPFKQALFLAPQDVPGSPRTLSHPEPEAAISLKNSDSFQREWYLETKIWMLGVLTDAGNASSPFQWAELGGNIYVYIFKPYIHIEVSN